jgi:hypothetical protein
MGVRVPVLDQRDQGAALLSGQPRLPPAAGSIHHAPESLGVESSNTVTDGLLVTAQPGCYLGRGLAVPAQEDRAGTDDLLGRRTPAAGEFSESAFFDVITRWVSLKYFWHGDSARMPAHDACRKSRGSMLH